MEQMELSIIIVNYKSSTLILNCLQSIFNQPPKIAFEILVIDNFSNDNSENIIRRQFPMVKWFQMGYNSGFARANNEGIRKSTGNAILLLNADTIIENNAIEICYKNFIQSDYVACGVQLLFVDRTPQISGNYFMKGGLNYLLPLPYLGHLFKGFATLLKVKKPNVPEAKDIVEVDWINGAFLMVKRSAIDKSGLLDEDFFLYAEEAEWCSRLKKAGKLCIYGDINVIHLQGETSGETFGSTGKGYKNLFDKRGLQIMFSNFVRIRKQFGVFWFLLDLFIYCVEIPVLFFGFIISNLLLKKKFTLLNLRQYTSNVFYILKLTPKIIQNKPFFYKTCASGFFFLLT